MSETKDQLDSPKQVAAETMQNIENEIKKAEIEIEAKKPKDVKLIEKEDKEDYWVLWGQLVNDWNNQYKKNTQYVKVSFIKKKKFID